MEEKDINESLNKFFRFYEDGYEETKPAYEKIIKAFVDAGVLDEKTTIDSVINKCKEIDKAEVIRTNGKVKEANIGLQGYFAQLGYSKENLKNDENARKLYNKFGLDAENLPKKADDRLEAINKAIGEVALKKILDNDKEKNRATIEAASFLGELAAGPYFPRTTCFSASHFMSEGHIMQIGCSQGKTSVVAMTTYMQLMQGKKVFSTSSAPGLVPENYDEAKAFYEKMGIEEEFCSISQNEKTNEDHIVLFHRGNNKEGKTKEPSEKYEIRKSGKIYIEREEKNSEAKTVKVMYEIKEGENGLYIENSNSEILDISVSTLTELSTELGMIEKNGNINFEESVKKMMNEKNIIMGDTITLGKYKDLIPKDADKHLIVDEADAEMYDTQPQEILGKEYLEEAKSRWEKRLQAQQKMNGVILKKGIENVTREDLEGLVTDKVPLDFIVDAYEATKFSKTNLATNEKPYEVKEGKIFVINPNTNVMQPASQGLAQAIIANDQELRKEHEKFIEHEVLGETDISDLLSEFDLVSLMSGTMQDKGMKEGSDPQYKEKRIRFFQKCSVALGAVASKGVIDWKLVTPKTREERGNVIVTTKGVIYNPDPDKEKGEKELTTNGEEGVPDWRTYIYENKDALEDNWKNLVQEEAQRRSEKGQPVMVSIYGDRNPMEPNVPIYTAQNQKDSKKMFVDKKGFGEIACFDDFYGRGYTFKFLDEKTGEKSNNGGHVLITSLPQNSRNLEQFLFRVARGGDKGSSSIIISPTDPVLLKYLEKIESAPEKGTEVANEFFNKVITGELSVDEIVATIYPEETKAIFNEKLHELEMKDVLNDYSKDMQSSISIIDEIGNGKKTDLSERYVKQYNKEVLKQMKLNKQIGTPESLEEQCDLADKIVKSTLKEMMKEHKIQNASELVALLPVGLTLEELEEIIPDGKLKYEVLTTMKKIDAYIERKNAIQLKEENTTDIEQSDNKRDTAVETFRAASQDIEYTLSETEKALAEIRESKINYREAKKEERKTEENAMEMGG